MLSEDLVQYLAPPGQLTNYPVPGELLMLLASGYPSGADIQASKHPYTRNTENSLKGVSE